MDIEKLLDQLARMNPYQMAMLRDEFERRHNRKMLAIVGRLVLGGAALLLWMLKG